MFDVTFHVFVRQISRLGANEKMILSATGAAWLSARRRNGDNREPAETDGSVECDEDIHPFDDPTIGPLAVDAIFNRPLIKTEVGRIEAGGRQPNPIPIASNAAEHAYNSATMIRQVCTTKPSPIKINP